MLRKTLTGESKEKRRKLNTNESIGRRFWSIWQKMSQKSNKLLCGYFSNPFAILYILGPVPVFRFFLYSGQIIQKSLKSLSKIIFTFCIFTKIRQHTINHLVVFMLVNSLILIRVKTKRSKYVGERNIAILN